MRPARLAFAASKTQPKSKSLGVLDVPTHARQAASADEVTTTASPLHSPDSLAERLERLSTDFSPETTTRSLDTSRVVVVDGDVLVVDKAPVKHKLVHRGRSNSLLNDALLHSRLPRNDSEPEADFTQAPADLSNVLRHPRLRAAFHNFVRQRHASEALLFLEAIEFYTTISNPSWRLRTASAMNDKYVKEGAPVQVNIGGTLREELLAAVASKRLNEDTYGGAAREMFVLLSDNHFQAFVEAFWPGGVLMCKPSNDPFAIDAPGPLHASHVDSVGSVSTIDSHVSSRDTIMRFTGAMMPARG